MKNIKLEVVGQTAMLMHADLLADPLDPATKEMKRYSGKSKKTDEDHETMARLEFHAGLYRDDTGQVVIPAPNLLKCLIEGARVSKRGPKIERGVAVGATSFPLDYQGPPADQLYAHGGFVSRMSVRVGQTKVMRVRPRFPAGWRFVAPLLVDESVINPEELAEIAQTAGALIGLGDYRKAGGFGRFATRVVE